MTTCLVSFRNIANIMTDSVQIRPPTLKFKDPCEAPLQTLMRAEQRVGAELLYITVKKKKICWSGNE